MKPGRSVGSCPQQIARPLLCAHRKSHQLFNRNDPAPGFVFDIVFMLRAIAVKLVAVRVWDHAQNADGTASKFFRSHGRDQLCHEL
jgi:hypothetical protein